MERLCSKQYLERATGAYGSTKFRMLRYIAQVLNLIRIANMFTSLSGSHKQKHYTSIQSLGEKVRLCVYVGGCQDFFLINQFSLRLAS